MLNYVNDKPMADRRKLPEKIMGGGVTKLFEKINNVNDDRCTAKIEITRLFNSIVKNCIQFSFRLMFCLEITV